MSLKNINFKILIPGIIICILLRVFCFYLIDIPTNSMQPTLNTKTKYFVTKIYKKIDRLDIITFKRKEDKFDMVKRVIGLPGEHVKIEDGIVYINNQALEESYVKYPGGIKSAEFDVPNNCYLVLGDNRANSLDSRYWENPYLNSNDIIGKVLKK